MNVKNTFIQRKSITERFTIKKERRFFRKRICQFCKIHVNYCTCENKQIETTEKNVPKRKTFTTSPCFCKVCGKLRDSSRKKYFANRKVCNLCRLKQREHPTPIACCVCSILFIPLKNRKKCFSCKILEHFENRMKRRDNEENQIQEAL